MASCHIPVKSVKRSEGRSAVEAAAYRSGTKMTNEWDGQTHDYTRKRGVIHTEIMLPPHAPPEFQDRSTLWNSVEQIEKAKDSQLAREIEAAPRAFERTAVSPCPLFYSGQLCGQRDVRRFCPA